MLLAATVRGAFLPQGLSASVNIMFSSVPAKRRKRTEGKGRSRLGTEAYVWMGFVKWIGKVTGGNGIILSQEETTGKN